jgi:PAS domain S-box-containing protein
VLEDIPAASLDGQAAASQALAAGSSQPMGSFWFYFDDDRWEWSDEVARIHGYEPGEVTPTTDLVLAHKHPDDRAVVATTIEQMRRGRASFSTRHRIIDAHGRSRHVIVAGSQLRDDNGDLVGAHGFYIDTTAREVTEQARITERVAEISTRRAVIEQAKGALMIIYDIDADTAFALLTWRSQDTNTKLKSLAEQIVSDFREVGGNSVLPPRSTYDGILMTAQDRIHDPGHGS